MDWNIERLERERQDARWRNTIVGVLLALAVFASMTLVWLCWLA